MTWQQIIFLSCIVFVAGQLALAGVVLVLDHYRDPKGGGLGLGVYLLVMAALLIGARLNVVAAP